MKYFFKKQDFDTDLDYILFLLSIIILVSLGAFYFLSKTVPPILLEAVTSCFFHKLTGFYCPGCGGTRAVEALLRFQFLNSFFYHPLPLYSTILGTFFLTGRVLARITKGRINKFHAKPFFLWLALFFIISNCILKNLFLFFFNIPLI